MPRPINHEKRQRQQEAFLAAFAKTGLAIKAAQEAGIPAPTHYRWLQDDVAYAERFECLKAQTRELAEANRKPYPREKRTGRPVDLEAHRMRKAAFLAALAHTGIVADAAREIGVYPAEFSRLCRSDPAFAEEARQVIAGAQDRARQATAERRSTAMKAAWERDGFREQMSEQRRELWSSPEMRAGATQRNLERMADPEYKERWLEAAKAGRPTACDNPAYFDQIDTPEKAYWLGFIATDGCVTGFRSGSLRLLIKLARKDRDHLVILHRVLAAKRPVRDREEWAKLPQGGRVLRGCSVLDVCSPQIVNALVGHGITPRKTHTYEPWDGPAELMPHYWRGVIDGDGSISLTDRDFKLCLGGTQALLEAWRAWAQATCGTTARVFKRSGSRNFWTINIGGTRQVRCLLAALYDDAPVALARKKALADLAVHGKPLQAGLF